MKERTLHRLFEIGVLLKGAHAVIECVGGLLLATLSVDNIVSIVNALTQEELVEDPNDVIAGYLLRAAHNFSLGSKNFYVFYLISHGVVKLALVYGLLRGQLWSYPASIIVLGLFIAYQLYRISYTHSIFLVGLTGLDLIVVVLVWHEWRLMRRIAG